jgi:hypothetical protein
MTERSWVYVIEADAAVDAVVRILNGFIVQDVMIEDLVLSRTVNILTLRVGTGALDEAKAEYIRAKLRTMLIVRGVSLGWRASPHPIHDRARYMAEMGQPAG